MTYIAGQKDSASAALLVVVTGRALAHHSADAIRGSTSRGPLAFFRASTQPIGTLGRH
jgi:hypothetical protein